MAESPPHQPTAEETVSPSESEIDEDSPEEFVPFRVRRPFLFRCLQMLLIGLVLAAFVGGALRYSDEPQFRSHAILLIRDQQPWLAFEHAEDSDAFAETQIEILRSPFIIEQSIQKESLDSIPELREIADKEDAVLWISQRLQVMWVGQSELYEVSFTTVDPESARKIVTAMVTTYLDFQLAIRESSLTRLLQLLDEEVILHTKKIERQRETVRDLAKQQIRMDESVLVGGRGRVPGNGGPPTMQTLLEQKLLTAEIELAVANARAQALADMVDAPIQIPANQIAGTLLHDPEIQRIMLELAGLRQSHDEANPSDKAPLSEAIATKQEALEARKAERRSALTAEAEAIVANLRRENLRLAQVDRHTAEVLIQILRDRLEVERSQQIHNGDKSPELQSACEELQRTEDIRRLISDRIVHLTTESRAPSRLSLLQSATLPQFPEDSGLWQQIAIAGTIVFLSPLALYISYSVIAARWRARQLTRIWTIVK